MKGALSVRVLSSFFFCFSYRWRNGAAGHQGLSSSSEKQEERHRLLMRSKERVRERGRVGWWVRSGAGEVNKTGKTREARGEEGI